MTHPGEPAPAAANDESGGRQPTASQHSLVAPISPDRPQTGPPTHEGLAAGTSVGRYEIVRWIGGGGLGDVYLARDAALARDVALKVIRPDMIKPARIDAFLNEARTTAQFSHPHIVVIHEVGTVAEAPYIALEYLDGPSLRERMLSDRPTAKEALRIALAVARALVAAHARNVVHRDLKPENVMVTADGRIRVVDFGLAAALDEFRRNVPMGTPAYMAPEQWSHGRLTSAVDCWSLAVLLHELLAGRRPVGIERGSLGPVGIDLSDAPEPLRDLVLAGLERDPQKRPTASVFADTIAQQLEHLRSQEDLRQTRHLFGRDVERRRLRQALDELQQRRGGAMVVLGEAGLGKTMLMADFVRRARESGAKVVTSAADAVHRHTSFYVWRSLVGTLIDGPQWTADRIRTRLHAVLPTQLVPFLPLFDTVVNLGTPETESTSQLHGQTRADVTIRFVCDLLSAIIVEPTVLVLDDCQWLDSASWRLVRAVVERLPHVLVVLSARPMNPVPADFTAICQADGARTIELPPLDDQPLRRLVQDRFGAEDLDGQLASSVLRHAAGNPLFAEELTRLVRGGGQASDAPPSVNDLLDDRLDDLPGPAADVLRTACVAGQRLDLALLEAIHGHLAKPLLDQLIVRGLLVVDDGAYSFRHALVREAAYDRLTPTERRERHAAVANWLESTQVDLTAHHATLADHWYEADMLDKAVAHADLAGKRALATGAWAEAIRFYERCLNLEPHSPSRSAPPVKAMRWRRRLAEAQYGLGDITARGVEASRALALADRELPRSGMTYLGAIAYQCVQLIGLQARPKQTAPVDSDEHLELARAFGITATVAWFQNQKLAVIYSAISAICEAERAGPSGELARACTELAAGLGFNGHHRAYRFFQKRARIVAERVSDRPAAAYARLIDGIYNVGIGRWTDAEASIAACQQTYDSLKDDTNWCNAQVVRYWLEHYRGSPGAAHTAAVALYERAAVTGHKQHRGWGARCLALELLRQGDLREARDLLERAIELVSGPSKRVDLIPAVGALAVTHLRAGDRGRALEAADRALELIEESRSPTSHTLLEGCSGAAEVLLAAQAEKWPMRTDRAAAWAVRRAMRALGRYKAVFPIGRARHDLWQGDLHQFGGRPDQARRTWQRGLQTAIEMNMKSDKALLQSRLTVPSNRNDDAAT